MTIQELVAQAQQLSHQELEDLIQQLNRISRTSPPPPISYTLMDLAGLGAEIWQDVDTQTYIRELRSEWDSEDETF